MRTIFLHLTAGLACAVLLPNAVNAQTQPPPDVDWRTFMAPPNRPGWGHDYTWDGINPGTTWTGTSVSSSVPQTPAESGEDWFYAHCNLYDANGEQIGYAAAGYCTYPDHGDEDSEGCFSQPIVGNSDPEELEALGHKKGQPYSWIARYNMKGTKVWCRTELPGTYYDVCQGADGKIVAIGEASANRMAESPVIPSYASTYNPGLGNSVVLPNVNCMTEGLGDLATKINVAKLDLNGNLEWNHLYGGPDGYVDGWDKVAIGQGIVPINVDGGAGFYLVGIAEGGPAGTAGPRPIAIRIQADGTIVDRHAFLYSDPAVTPLNVPSTGEIRPLAVEKLTFGGTTHLAITGRYFAGSSFSKAFLWELDDIENAPYTVSFVQHTDSPELIGTASTQHDVGRDQLSSAVCFATHSGVLNLVWPVVSNFEPGTWIYAGRSVAELLVHRFDMTGAASPVWTADLGEVRAYDLQADATQTSDGNIAVVSTKWSIPYSSSSPFRYNDLSQAAKDCLANTYSYNGPNSPNWQNTNVYDYWNTDAYVAKVNINDGAKIWETTFDASPELEAECSPGDLRKQECMYKITEAEDGGLVISGNTSRNLDDSYLAKLYPDCQYKMDYTAIDALLDANNEFHVTANTAWSSDMNVHGKVIVEQGAKLTINNGATISFADSKKRADVTRIVVAPGGKLSISGSAKLTSMNATCPGSFWDGILVQGDPQAAQYPIQSLPQGYVNLNSATIANARIGILTANGFLPYGSMAQYEEVGSSGGVVQATSVTFLDNIRDVLFSPYENHIPNDASHVLANISRFNSCTFTTSHMLANENITPANHTTLYGVRGINFTGCISRNNAFPYAYHHISDLGTGIYSLNSSFTVKPGCSSVPPVGGTCPAADVIPSRFEGLVLGVIASSFDPGKTFSVDRTSFKGCVASIRMSSIQDAAITRCDIDVAEPGWPGWISYPYGVYSNQCTGYQIDGNHFTSTQPDGLQKVGLIINNSGPDPNIVYNNTFDNFTTKASCGAIIEGNNASANFNDGLEIKCNDFGLDQVNAYDIALTTGHPTIARRQGDAALNGTPDELRKPAGNRFSWNCIGANPENDIWVKTASNLIEYWYHHENGNHTKPLCYDASYITPFDAGQQYTTKEEVCPSSFGGKTIHLVKMEAIQADADLAEKESTYTTTKDDGNTQSLLAYVSYTGHTGTGVRDALLDAAPAVGVDCFNAAFARLPDLSPWHLTQVLMACSPLQPEVVDLLHTSGLDPFYIQLVDQAQSGDANILSLLESAQSRLAHQKGDALTDLGRYSWLDTLDIGSMLDSLSGWHAQIPAMNSPMTMAGIYMATQAYSDLEALALEHESDTLKGASFGVLRRLAEAQQADGWNAPSADTRTWLEGLAIERDSIGSALANAWLVALGDTLPPEVIVLPDTMPLPKMLRVPNVVKHPVGTLLAAYPNPSNGPIYLVYHLPEGVEHAYIHVVDLTGREVENKALSNLMGILELQTGSWAAGLYAAELDMDDQRATTIKLAIAKR